ncbi:MAG: YqiA/YcfP family alpha/beta fold hydrolase [Cellvibrionaceae bacterium]
MTTLVYIHGFLSSPFSAKAQQTKHWLSQNRSDIDYICPQLTPYPDECANLLEKCIADAAQPIYLMGSSMGGFWATWLAEKYNYKAVLINPAVDVLGLMPAYLNMDLKNYHSDDSYYLTQQHYEQLHAYHLEHLDRLENYWLLVQTGDETLDYRLAVEKYTGCRQTVEQQGDHSFQGFERFIASAIEFYEAPGHENNAPK